MYRRIIIDSTKRTSGSNSSGTITLNDKLNGDYVIEKFIIQNNVKNINFNTETYIEIKEYISSGTTLSISIPNNIYDHGYLSLYLTNVINYESSTQGNGHYYLVTYDSVTNKFTFSCNNNFSITYFDTNYMLLGFNKPTLTSETTSIAKTITSTNSINLNTLVNLCFMNIGTESYKKNIYIDGNNNWLTSFIIPFHNVDIGKHIVYDDNGTNKYTLIFNNVSTITYNFHNVNNIAIDMGGNEWKMLIHRIQKQ